MDKIEVEAFVRCPGNSPACLGMVEFDCCGRAHERKRKGLSLPKPPKKKKQPLSPKSRFTATTDSEVQEVAKGYIPSNTAKNTEWAVNTYTTWAKHKSAQNSGQVPSSLI